MTASFPRRATVVWVVLVLVTAATFWMGTEHPFLAAGGRVAPALALVAAFVKAYLVGREFMEVRGGPPALRWVFTTWISGFGGITLIFLWV